MTGVRIAALLLAGALTGCVGTPTLRAHVETFSTLDSSPAPAAVAIVPFVGVEGDSLEFRTYRDGLAEALEDRGFEVVALEAEPPWLMELGYRVSEGRSVVRSVPGSPYPLSSRHRRFGVYDPFFEYDRLVTYEVYARQLALVLVDAGGGEEVWRASAVSFGQRPTLMTAFEGLVAAALADFPAEGARTLDVRLMPEE